MNNYIWFILVGVLACVIIFLGLHIVPIFWIFLLAVGLADFIEEFGKAGKGEWSFIIRVVGFLFLLVLLLSAIFLISWKAAVLILFFELLIVQNINLMFVSNIFRWIRKTR